MFSAHSKSCFMVVLIHDYCTYNTSASGFLLCLRVIVIQWVLILDVGMINAQFLCVSWLGGGGGVGGMEDHCNSTSTSMLVLINACSATG